MRQTGRAALMMLAIATGTAVIPPGAEAQQTSGMMQPLDVASVTPYAGVLLWDDDWLPWDVRGTNFYGGVHARVPLAGGLGLTGDLALGIVEGAADDVTTTNPFDVSRHETILIIPTLGVDYGLSWGNTSLVVGIGGGVAAWRSEPPEASSSDFSPYPLMVPSLAIEQRVGERIGVRVRMADLYFTESGLHNPAITLGLDFRL